MITGKFPSLRLRRTRKYAWSRKLVQENNLSVNDLIYPIFLIEGKNKKQIIKSMPNIYRYTLDKLGEVVNNVVKNNIPMVALFPSTPIAKKDKYGSEALNENNLVCRATQIIKKRFKNNIGVMCDVALDPYTSHGHDGLLKNNYVINDETNDILIKQSILQAQMGCDVIAPSDMMDGRIGKIRKALDKNKFHDIQLLSYAVKYASNFYGPFRDAVGSKKYLKSDKRNYQMDFSNKNESLREVALDVKEGADMIMVKPGMPYLDIIKTVKDNFKIPVLAYQVSGEYSMIKQSINNKLINEESIIESLMCFKRAGASAIVTYFALDIAKKL
ncbi:porphobilinogen synthase [Candidatus Pelagibacter bacterium]|jgi:porphobilinogen synthase|nr:porphobilinogen synthase [Candidatus Pelagibacter bacterium]|tara:strand:- start:235 stop:1221 length:987 start_codon:yes stop_codon:yes gene_type:complete